MKKLLALSLMAVGLSACALEADVASRNMSIAADQFQVMRRIVFYNGITGAYILSVEGFCSLGNYDKEATLSVTCKTGPSEYKKHFLGLSDNVTFFAEQLDPKAVSGYRYKVIFRPAQIIPDIEVQ